MAQRRAPAKQRAPSAAPTDDFDFLASQQSSGSDDQAIQVAIAHQLMASREKKRKEQEKKFFQIAKNKLTAEISAATDDVRSTIETTEKAYTKFILDYAALEDTIRALWMEIKNEEQTLIEIAKKQRIANDAVRTTMETTGYTALGQIKESCHAGRQVVDTLMPPAV
ncbi:hypothetical protein DFH08DRAFT_54790 [Mycena albidolilacea]|uniref:Uncharacterized protein n=1 Tax=Mycena albidolilacea TaxID=1033008 RepID=A0AAD6Z1G5_9AGAR|nr:hypothetical protein DFH08DRAFT_54790 [Mycena albidolilacea]